MDAAVVSASQGAMGSLLGKLGDLLADKYKLLKEAKDEITFLKAELENMHAFLKKMSDVEEPDEQAKCWVKEVRELSYDIEDAVDEFMHRVDREPNSKPHGFKGFIDRSKNLLTTISTHIWRSASGAIEVHPGRPTANIECPPNTGFGF